MINKKILNLSLKRELFEVMVTGEKCTEYRKPSRWILSRLIGKEYDLIKFVNGYGNDRPYFIAEYNGWGFELFGYKSEYSNGLTVNCERGTVKIYVGAIIEVKNSLLTTKK